MGNIGTKIYRKLTDFVGNYIINVKTNTPVNPDDVSNKKYVDKQSTYDTTLSNNDSTKFSWMKNLHNKSIKEILDMLLYPSRTENYVNPTLVDCRVKLLDNISGDNEAIINSGNNVKLQFIFELSPTQRQSNVLPKIVFTKNNGQQTEFQLNNNEYNTDTLTGIKTVEIDMLSIKTVQLIQQYEAISGTVPAGFDLPYLLDIPLLPIIKSKFYIFEPIYRLPIPDTELTNLNNLTDAEKYQKLEQYIIPKLNQFERGNTITLNQNSLNKFGFIFVSDNVINCNLETLIKSKVTNHLLSRNTYSYDDFKIKAFRTVNQLAPHMGNVPNLLYTDVTRITSFVFVYWEFGNVKESSEVHLTYDKIYYEKI